VEAYQVASPTTISSGALTSEKRFLGAGLQPNADETLPRPAILRKVRRFISEKISRFRTEKIYGYRIIKIIILTA
jgi:hypothetical protein